MKLWIEEWNNETNYCIVIQQNFLMKNEANLVCLNIWGVSKSNLFFEN